MPRAQDCVFTVCLLVMTHNFEINWAINTDTNQETFMQDHKIIWGNDRPNLTSFINRLFFK